MRPHVVPPAPSPPPLVISPEAAPADPAEAVVARANDICQRLVHEAQTNVDDLLQALLQPAEPPTPVEARA
jgi:hypothetical protein